MANVIRLRSCMHTLLKPFILSTLSFNPSYVQPSIRLVMQLFVLSFSSGIANYKPKPVFQGVALWATSMSGLVQSSRTSLTSPLCSTGRRAGLQCPRLCGVLGNPTMPATPRIMSCLPWNNLRAKCASMIILGLSS